MLESVFPTDTNPRGNLFGGTMVAWMDKVAGYAALRHARTSVVTASIERIDFAVGVRLGDMIELEAEVTRVGRSSMQIHVEAWREPLDGSDRELCTRGDFTMVALDDDGKPSPVPPLPRDD